MATRARYPFSEIHYFSTIECISAIYPPGNCTMGCIPVIRHVGFDQHGGARLIGLGERGPKVGGLIAG